MFPLQRLRITRLYRTSVALEEERLWVGFYRRVDNPAIAAEVIRHLDADADQKQIHPALYLQCKESLRKKKAHQARIKRIRSFLRRILGGLLRHSASNLRLQQRGRVVVHGLSESRRESAPQMVKSWPQAADLAAVQPDAGGQPNAMRLPTPGLDAISTAPRTVNAA